MTSRRDRKRLKEYSDEVNQRMDDMFVQEFEPTYGLIEMQRMLNADLEKMGKKRYRPKSTRSTWRERTRGKHGG